MLMTTELDMLSMFMKVTDICSSGTDEEKLDAKARMIFATNGIIRPDNWDTLSFDEKKQRVDKIEEMLADG